MSDLLMRFKMDDAAFEDDPLAEAARIVQAVADRIKEGYDRGVCVDLNGNTVGQWRID